MSSPPANRCQTLYPKCEHVCLCLYTSTCVHPCVCMFANGRAHMLHTHVCTYTHTSMHRTRACVCTRIHSCVHVCPPCSCVFVHVLYLYMCLHALCLCACAESSKLNGRAQLGRHYFYRSLIFKQKVLLEISLSLAVSFSLLSCWLSCAPPPSAPEPRLICKDYNSTFPCPHTGQSQALVIFF